MPVTIRRLSSGLYRVRTPGGVKARGTTLKRAQGQRRILEAAEHDNQPVVEKIPLDSIVADAPPLYKLSYLITADRQRHTPAVDVAMFPAGEYDRVDFKFWGMSSYDVHIAFPKLGHHSTTISDEPIIAISYSIIVIGKDGPSIRAAYVHHFRKPVDFSLRGIHAYHRFFELYRELEHLPKLPKDWAYMQFIG